jgi:hypothetical protein
VLKKNPPASDAADSSKNLVVTDVSNIFPCTVQDIYGMPIKVSTQKEYDMYLEQKRTSIARYFLKSATFDRVEVFTIS